MSVHGCTGNPCWLCYPELAPKNVLVIPFIPNLDNMGSQCTLRYKDESKISSPWLYWKTTDRPSNVMIETLKKEGMHFLEIISSNNMNVELS